MITDLAAAQAEWLREFAAYARNEIADGAVDTGDQQAASVMDDMLTVITAAGDALATVGMRTGIQAHLDLVQAVTALAQSFAVGLEYTQEYPR